MAEVHASAEIDIEATPETVWDVLTDLEAFPTWSKIHKDVRIESHNDEGWPERVWMKMSYTRGIQNNPKGNIDLWYLSAAQQWGGMKAAIVMAQEAMDQVSARAIC